MHKRGQFQTADVGSFLANMLLGHARLQVEEIESLQAIYQDSMTLRNLPTLSALLETLALVGLLFSELMYYLGTLNHA